MTMNDDTEELKKERRNLLSAVKRRRWAVLAAESDIRKFSLRIMEIQATLTERKKNESSV